MSLRLHPRRIANELQRISTSRLSFEMVIFVSRHQISFTFNIQTKVKEGGSFKFYSSNRSLPDYKKSYLEEVGLLESLD